LGKIAVKSDRADSFRLCLEEMQLNRWGVAQCWLDPAVDFLANRATARTFARFAADNQGREVLWATTMPLAWEVSLRSNTGCGFCWG